MRTIRFILLLSLLFCQLNIYAQTPLADSLKKVLINAKLDTNRVNMLGELAYQVRSVNPDTALLLGLESYTLAKKLNYEPKLDNILRVIGIIHFYDQNPDSAEWYFNKSGEIAEQTGDQMTQANVAMNLATLYKSSGKNEQAIEAYKNALKIEKTRGNKAGEGAALNNIGTMYLDSKDYGQAEDYFLQALSIQEQVDNQPFESFVLNNLGLLANQQNDLEKSIEYYQRSLNITREIQDKSREAVVLAKMGRAYRLNGLFAQSLEYYLERLKLLEEIGAESKIGQAVLSLGNFYQEIGDIDLAITQYNRALKIYENLGDTKNQGLSFVYLGQAYILQNNHEEALSYLEIHKSLQDSIFNRENTRTISQIEANYKFEQEKQQLAFENEKKLAK